MIAFGAQPLLEFDLFAKASIRIIQREHVKKAKGITHNVNMTPAVKPLPMLPRINPIGQIKLFNSRTRPLLIDEGDQVCHLSDVPIPIAKLIGQGTDDLYAQPPHLFSTIGAHFATLPSYIAAAVKLVLGAPSKQT